MHRHPEPIPFLLQQTLTLRRLKTLHPTPFTDPINGLLFGEGQLGPVGRIAVILHQLLVQRKKDRLDKRNVDKSRVVDFMSSMVTNMSSVISSLNCTNPVVTGRIKFSRQARQTDYQFFQIAEISSNP
jgi:hypothetical protein